MGTVTLQNGSFSMIMYHISTANRFSDVDNSVGRTMADMGIFVHTISIV